MQAVLARLDQPGIAAVLEERRRIGADRWDECWERVLHMVPAPNMEHQQMLMRIAGFLDGYCRRIGRGSVYFDVNVAPPGGWPHDYRVPDLVFIAAGREDRIAHDGACFEGPPDTVFEIESEAEEALQKLPFYRALGVPEFVVIHRDSKQVQVYVLAGAQYCAQRPDVQGWYLLERLGVEIRRLGPAEPAAKPGLELRVAGAQESLRI